MSLSSNFSLEGKHILLAEDCKTNQFVCCEILKRLGAFVTIVNDGNEVLQLLIKRKHFDAILMDIDMPKLNGLEATSTIRKFRMFEDIPIIAFSAWAKIEKEKECFKVGMNAYLEKPIRMDRLKNILSDLLF